MHTFILFAEHSIVKDSATFETNNVVSVLTVPHQIILGFVKTQAFTGSLSLNPYEFKFKFKNTDNEDNAVRLKNIKMTINGKAIQT